MYDYDDFLNNFTFQTCPFEKSPLHMTTNGCCLGINNGTQYHIFKKIPYALDSNNKPLSVIFENNLITYYISPYCKEPNYIRLMTQLNSEYEYMTSLLTTNKSVLSFLQRHMYKYFVEILPRMNNYLQPAFNSENITQNAIPYENQNPFENFVLNQDSNNSQIQLRTRAITDDQTPFMIYINSLMLEQLQHLHPLCIFDVAILKLQQKVLCYLKPVQLTHSFYDFLVFYRSILFEIIYAYAKTDDCKKTLIENPRKLKVRSLCHAEYFTSERNTPPEFKCVASTEAACPHINDNLLPNGKVPLTVSKTLCSFLIQKYIADYSDSQINTLLGFRCRFQDQLVTDNKNGAKEKLFAFYNIFSKTNNIHRMCVPDQYLTADWLKWVISIMHI